MVKTTTALILSLICNFVPSSIWGLLWSLASGTSIVSASEAGESLTQAERTWRAPNYYGAFTYVIALVRVFASDDNSNSCNGGKHIEIKQE